MARVPTSSGLLEDKYTLETTFTGNDHRRHRKREWLVDGLKKIDQLRFLVIEGERTMAQAALKFILAQERMACVIPTITTLAELEEFAGAAERAGPHGRGAGAGRRALRVRVRARERARPSRR